MATMNDIWKSRSKTASRGDDGDDVVYIETLPIRKNLKRRAESSEANDHNVETPPQKRQNRSAKITHGLVTGKMHNVETLPQKRQNRSAKNTHSLVTGKMPHCQQLWAQQDAAGKQGASKSPMIQLGVEKPWSWSDVHKQQKPTINKDPACESSSPMIQLQGERPWSWDSIPKDKTPMSAMNSTMQKKPTSTSPSATVQLRDERPWSWDSIPKDKRPVSAMNSTMQKKPTYTSLSAMAQRREEQHLSSQDVEMTGMQHTPCDAANAITSINGAPKPSAKLFQPADYDRAWSFVDDLVQRNAANTNTLTNGAPKPPAKLFQSGDERVLSIVDTLLSYRK
ncbi:hypothetical protein F4680DRAFT_465919 [Xylaria scruposa]|nr:hypothetical protein F4680DRAFT_465919 [Xylaria scruposa]